jgi:hypothetical protein
MAYKRKMLRIDDSLLGEQHLCAIREGSKKKQVRHSHLRINMQNCD